MSDPSALDLRKIWLYFDDNYRERTQQKTPKLGHTHHFKQMGTCELRLSGTLSGTLPTELASGHDDQTINLGEEPPSDQLMLQDATWKFVKKTSYDQRSRKVQMYTLDDTILFKQSDVSDVLVDVTKWYGQRPCGLKIRLKDSSRITSPRDAGENATLLLFWAYAPTEQNYDAETGKFESRCFGRLFRDGEDTRIGDRTFRAGDAGWRRAEAKWLQRSTNSESPADSDVEGQASEPDEEEKREEEEQQGEVHY